MRDEGTGQRRDRTRAVLVAPASRPAPDLSAPQQARHLAAILAARNTDALARSFMAAVRPLGFDRIVYGLARFLPHWREGATEDLFLHSTHPEAYNRVYFDGGMFRHAPMMEWVRTHTGAKSWSWARVRLASGACSPQEIAVLEFNARHDVVAGYTLSFADLSGNGRGAFGLCAAAGIDQGAVDATWHRHGDAITRLAHVAHLRFAALARPPLSRPLTARQREVLEWAANGKSVGDIAEIIGLRPATVEKHLRLARETLGAETTVQAAVKAALLNVIFIAAPEKGSTAGALRQRGTGRSDGVRDSGLSEP